jgi:exocyst complex component 7
LQRYVIASYIAHHEFIRAVEKIEYDLLLELAPLPGQATITNTYSTFVNPLITVFSSTLSALASLIKRSLHKHTFLALSVYGNLTALQPRWDDLLCRRAGRKENELKDGLHSIRASCLRCFPELLADIRAAALSTRAETSTGLADFTLSVSCYW